MSGVRTPRSFSRRELLSLDPAEPLTHIVSLLVHARPDALDALRARASNLPGAEVHETAQPGKLAIVLESAHDREIADAVTVLQDCAGVISVAIVAHLAEPTASLSEEVVDG